MSASAQPFRRTFPGVEMRGQLARSAAVALESGSVNPAVLAGLLLLAVDHVTSHALDLARDLKGYRHHAQLVEYLEAVQREERGG